MSEKYWAKSACPYDCPDACGLLVETDGEKVYRVKGDPDHPITDGFVCRKMAHYERTVHNEHRILYPMKRTGKKGDGQFERISWDEATDIITDRFKMLIENYGPHSILPYSYAGTEHMIQNKCGEAFFNRMGALQLIRTICSRAKTAGFEQMYGETPGICINDIPSSDFIIMWGGNIKATWLHAYRRIIEAHNRGVRVILIETYANDAADAADDVVLVRPGSDGALALAMAKILRDHHLLDMDFLKNYTDGWEEFLNSLDSYTLSWASEITGLSEAVIEKLALEYGHAKAPLIVFGSGFSRHQNGAMNTRCIAALPALCGAFLQKGAGYLGHINAAGAFNRDIVRRPDWAEGNDGFVNMNQLAEALTERQPKVRALYVYNSNPANVTPRQADVLKGLAREDLFTVVHERFMTDTARYADIILPADTSVEHGDIVTPYGSLCVQVTNPVIPPLGECKCNWDTFCILAQKMGYDDEMWSLSNEELKKRIIEDQHPWRELWTAQEKEYFASAKGGVMLVLPDSLHFKTKSGKIMLKNDSLQYPLPTLLEDKGMKQLKVRESGWLSLVVAPSIYTLNTIFAEQEEFLRQRGPARLKMNTNDALSRGICCGDRITAENEFSHADFYADVSDNVVQGTVVAEGIYALKDVLGEYSVNALLSTELTDAGEGSTFCDNLVKVCKKII